jgi:glucose-6-phosphate-specific signal transduction histidine kinase
LKNRIGFAFIICTLLGIFFIGQQYFWAYSAEREFNVVRDSAYHLIYFYVWGILFFFIAAFAGRYRLEKDSWKKNLPLHIIAGIIIALLHRLLTFGIYTGIFAPLKFAEAFPWKFSSKIINGAFDSFLAYWFLVGLYYGYDYYTQFKSQKIKAARLETQLAQAQLNALKMQLHPHFLFNTMHAISSLMEEDVKSAQRMIAKLSDLLRITLDNAGVQIVSLNQELDFLKGYLEIQQTRFHDRLNIEYKIDKSTLNAEVPNLLLQPLVENAIKHGISPQAEGGKIEIYSAVENQVLSLRVTDDGKGNGGKEVTEGIGIKNIRERLDQLYGKNYSMQLSSDSGKGFSVIIKIPFKKYKLNEQ